MNTIFVSGKSITFYMYNMLMAFLIEKVGEGCTLLQEENEEGEAHSLQYGYSLYSMLEMGKDDIFFAFSGAWDMNPHFERNLAFYYGVFKTPECRGNVKLPIGKPTNKNFADSTRFRRIAEGLYNAAKGIAEKKLNDVFYMVDGNEILYVENGSVLYITHDDMEQTLSVYRRGDFEFFDNKYTTILEFGGVNFYAPETDDAE